MIKTTKIWIVRDSASSIMFGGLDRLWIHFREPRYLVEPMTAADRDTPMGDISESEGYYRYFGWHSNENSGLLPIRFGKWLGYDDHDNPNLESVLLVWGELCKHFHNKPFAEWHDIEKRGEVKIQDFKLELDIKLSMNLVIK